MKRFLYTLCLLLIVATSATAYTPSENAKFSILTASSGKEVYKVYGHSAIRFQDKSKHKDIVYNYGLFSFDAPHFILNYLRGYNYYLLGRQHFSRFYREYSEGGEKVYEQTLNLTQEETKQLFDALEKNARPENREYLYNVFYDNCATRVYHIVDKGIDGGIVWNKEHPEVTFRDMLHQYNHIMPFSQMGIDLVFSIKADKETTFEEQLFLPENVRQAFDKAIKYNGEPLVSNETILLEGRKIHNNRELIIFNLTLLMLLLFAIWIRFRKQKFIRAYRVILYLILGLSSLIVCFIAFFSIHPTVLPNINLIWINPLWLFFAGSVIFKKQPQIVFQKALNIWSIIIALFLVLGISGVFYLHYGFYYLLPIIVLLSYRRINKA